VERWGFEDPACGEEVSAMVRKETKKRRKKNITLLACPRMQAMAAAGVGTKGKRQRWHGGLRAPDGVIVVPLA